MRPTLYEFAGGDAAFLRLARAHHARCLADPELNHPFSHPGQHPQHIERLAAYWVETFGGPASYSALGADQSSLVAMHAGNGDMSDLGRRFLACFVAAADDADLPKDSDFRTALQGYMEWAIQDVALSHPDSTSRVPQNLPIPLWGWNGRE
jgi:hemoglobin